MNKKVAIGLGLVFAVAALGSAAYAQAGRSGALEQVARFDHQVTGVAVTAHGRRFVNFPRWTDDAPISVAEGLPNGSFRPYPDAKWNSWRNARANELPVGEHFVCVQSIVPDGQGNLWVLDPGAPGNEKILVGAPKLVRIDLATNRVTKVIATPEALVANALSNASARNSDIPDRTDGAPVEAAPAVRNMEIALTWTADDQFEKDRAARPLLVSGMRVLDQLEDDAIAIFATDHLA